MARPCLGLGFRAPRLTPRRPRQPCVGRPVGVVVVIALVIVAACSGSVLDCITEGVLVMAEIAAYMCPAMI